MTPPLFGFTVQRGYHYTSGEYDDTWLVYLPHQCDEWEIAGRGGGGGVTREDADRRLRAFIAEARRALTSLRAGRELDGEQLLYDNENPPVPASEE